MSTLRPETRDALHQLKGSYCEKHSAESSRAPRTGTWGARAHRTYREDTSANDGLSYCLVTAFDVMWRNPRFSLSSLMLHLPSFLFCQLFSRSQKAFIQEILWQQSGIGLKKVQELYKCHSQKASEMKHLLTNISTHPTLRFLGETGDPPNPLLIAGYYHLLSL